MEEMGSAAPAAAAQNALAMNLRQSASSMSAWLKFLGIIWIVGGALYAITIVGILIAWLPIWMGVLLFQAGDRARNLETTEDLNLLNDMLLKLKTYFVITGVTTIVGVVFTIGMLFFILLVGGTAEWMQELENLNY